MGSGRAWLLGRFALVAVVVVAFSFTLWVYTLKPYVYGIDGPYYLVQYFSLGITLGWSTGSSASVSPSLSV